MLTDTKIQFGGVVYNLDKLNDLFVDENREMMDEAEAVAMHLKYDQFSIDFAAHFYS
jgi:hypothetical protein